MSHPSTRPAVSHPGTTSNSVFVDHRSLLPDSAEIQLGRLTVGGIDLPRLAERWGTPLYVYDEQMLRDTARKVLAAFAALDARVSFAAKACAQIAVLRVFRDEGLDVDVVSEGEMQAALRAGFLPGQIHLHGNVKTDRELEQAVAHGIRVIVVDSLDELRRLAEYCAGESVRARIMLRLALPIEAETHPHLRTSGRATKFGIPASSVDLDEALGVLSGNPWLELVGIHVHLGSQIASKEIYRAATTEIVGIAADLRQRGFPVAEASLGGGWAVPYVPGDPTLPPEDVAQAMEPAFASEPWLRPAVEPGRALVGRSGLAVYRIGAVKHAERGRIVAVDGGMGDNPRHALYGARYTAFLPERLDASPTGSADIVGRYCESGDVLARSVSLPDAAAGDLVCIPMAGAYHLSMASAYNLVPPPAAVMVRDGRARLILRRASIDDLLAGELPDAEPVDF